MKKVGAYQPKFSVFSIGGPEDVAWAAEQGFSAVGVWCATRNNGTMTYHFASPALEEAVSRSADGVKWALPGDDVLTPIAEAAHARGLEVMVNLESVNPWHWPAGQTRWTPDLLADVVTDLRRCGADRWFTEVFGVYSDFFWAIADRCGELGMIFQEGTDPEFSSTPQFQTPANWAELYRRAGFVGMYCYYLQRDVEFDVASLAQAGALGFGLAKGWGYPTAAVYAITRDWGIPTDSWPGVMRAWSLIAGLQFRVDEIQLIHVDEDNADQVDVRNTSRWIADCVALQEEETRPLLNLVIELGNGADSHWLELAASVDAIASGAFESGYNLVCTTEPLEEADAYWIYTRGHDAGTTWDLSPAVVELPAGNRTVFVQCGGRVPSAQTMTAGWARVLAACGVDPAGAFDSVDMPEQGVYKGASVRYTGFWTHGGGHHLRSGTLIPGRAVTGETYMVSGETPLVIGRNGRYLVPATSLSWQMKHPIGDLLSGYGTTPDSNVWGISGDKVTALLAIQDTDLELRIPRLPDGAKIRSVVWDRNHHKSLEETGVYHAPYRRRLEQYDLLLIEPVTPSSR